MAGWIDTAKFSSIVFEIPSAACSFLYTMAWPSNLTTTLSFNGPVTLASTGRGGSRVSLVEDLSVAAGWQPVASSV